MAECGPIQFLTVLCVVILLATYHAESRQHDKERRDAIGNEPAARNPVECGRDFRSWYGHIESPNYPGNYSNDMECIYHITYNYRHRIHLSFLTFATEEEFDVVFIYDGPDDRAPLLGSYSGTTIPDEVTTTGSDMTLKFTSDSKIVNRGFKAAYRTVDRFWYTTANYLHCDDDLRHVYTADHGVITSPYYPRNVYPRNQDCYYTIDIGDENVVITLTADHFQTEAGADYLLVYDGDTDAYPLIATYSGFKYGHLATSSGSKMCLRFYSDGAFEDVGFSITYDAIRTYTSTPMTGFISACCFGFILIIVGIIACCRVYRKQPSPRYEYIPSI